MQALAQITFNINNLFDKTHFGSMEMTLYPGIYAAPRNAMLTLRTAF